MPKVIGSTYEVIKELGSGGGGVVYLANHLRLNKQVVLKADKRQLTTRPELLRREVDVLKNLRHPYIPQVYDFFVEDETVYTAMDFVDGESLDRPLKRGERFSQPQVIRWGRQLLRALDYLHRPIHGDPPRGYVHSDIKPANLMRRNNGDICLIDFNISLALGEENVIGASAGYASPEHYGLDFSFSSATVTQNDATVLMGDATVTLPASHISSTTSKRKTIIPDVRSDIYSTGATLYHLISGSRPAKDAKMVTPLAQFGINGQVADIIAKAMDPNPDLRYQTAAEMLWDLEHLRENDVRTRRLEKGRRATGIALAALFLAGGMSTLAGLGIMERAQAIARQEAEQAAVMEQESREALRLVQSAQEAFRAGDRETAKKDALAALDKTSPYTAAAQRALTQALGVYDLTDGFKTQSLTTLPSRIIKQVISPQGEYVAVLTSGQVTVVESATGRVVAQLPANPSAHSDMVFSGENTLIYAGANGLAAYDLAAGAQLWEKDSSKAKSVAISGDGSKLAVTENGGDLGHFYDVATGEPLGYVDWFPQLKESSTNDTFADPLNDLFALDDSGQYLAVSFDNGALYLMDRFDSGKTRIILEESDYTYFEGGFFGGVLGVCAGDGATADFLAIDIMTGETVSALSSNQAMHLKVCEDGFCLAQSNVLVRLDPMTGEQTELAYTQEGILGFSHIPGRTLVQTQTGGLLFFDENAVLFDRHDISNDFVGLAGEFAALSGRDAQTLQILQLERYPEKTLATYPGDYFHDEARVTSSGNILLYSAEGARVYGLDGTLLGETDFPVIKDWIYDLQYRREADGEYLEVMYDSIDEGVSVRLSVEDLSTLREDKIPLSDKTLYEEFQVGDYTVASPLHETPTVVNTATGETLKELESDGYLTYVTEVGDGVITEYVTTDGTRYGLLLNKNWEAIADLPGLCDILPDGTMIFDDGRGTLRQSKIYTLDELRELARQ